MRNKALEILIIIVILVLLSLCAFAFLDMRSDGTEAKELIDNKDGYIFEIVPYSTEPSTVESSLWLESDIIPPPSIYFYDGDKTIEYIPNPEPNEPVEIFSFEETIEALLNDNSIPYEDAQRR